MQKNEDLNGIEFSIVIPVYNTREVLEECVRSAQNQTFDAQRYEIILVDDGSDDGSETLCDALARKDPRIIVLHQRNQGLSAARNIGIRIANGKYILFLDSDDTITANACADLYRISKDQTYDMIVTNLTYVYEKEERMLRHDARQKQVMSGKAYLLHELKHHTMHMAAVLNVYRRSFFMDHKLSFKPGIYHEDEEFTPRAFLCADSIYVSDLCFYRYRMRNDSITNRKDLYRNVHDLYETLQELELLYEKEKEPLRAYLKESLLEKYLYMYAKANVCDAKYDAIRNKQFVKGKALSKKNRCKAMLFLLSDTLYCRLSRRKGG